MLKNLDMRLCKQLHRRMAHGGEPRVCGGKRHQNIGIIVEDISDREMERPARGAFRFSGFTRCANTGLIYETTKRIGTKGIAENYSIRLPR